MRTKPCIHVLVAYWCRGNKMLALIIITTLLIAYYGENTHLTDNLLQPTPKKCKIHFLALVSPSVCFIFCPFGFVVLKKSIRVTKNLPPTSSIYGKWMLGSIIKFHRERELGFNKVRKKAQHSNLTGGYFPIFSCFKI